MPALIVENRLPLGYPLKKFPKKFWHLVPSQTKTIPNDSATRHGPIYLEKIVLDFSVYRVYTVNMNPLKGQELKPKKERKEHVVAVRLTPEMYQDLQKLAEEDERSVSFLVRKAVEHYLSPKR